MNIVHSGIQNFGDALNPYVFNKLAPELFSGSDDVGFLGIGSILGIKKIEQYRRKIVFSSGYAKGYTTPPQFDSSWDIVCVRGPLTASALNLPHSLAVMDGAGLIRGFKTKAATKRYEATFVPHHSCLEDDVLMRKICEEHGINYLSPNNDVAFIMDELKASRIVFAEAMHAAIVADALRVPWVPVFTSKAINVFKWKDWTSSLSVPFNPLILEKPIEVKEMLVKVRRKLPAVYALADTRGSRKILFKVFYELRARNMEKKINTLKNMNGFLSDDVVLDEKVDQLMEGLDYVKRTYD